jgi:hypothetical protein
MLGSSCCCGDCAKCAPGTKLPDAVTVTFAGKQGEKERGHALITGVVKSNFGSGARLAVEADPGSGGGCADTDKGPISKATKVSGGEGYAIIGRRAPEVSARVAVPPGLEGNCPDGTIEVTLAEGSDAGKPFWYISSVQNPPDCTGLGGCAVAIDFEPGTVFVNEPVINFFLFDNHTSWDGSDDYLTTKVITKGYFYVPDPTNVIKADVEVEIVQKPPSNGDGAHITAVIDDDPASPGFGEIKEFTIDNGGHDYLAWEWKWPCDCFGDSGREIVLGRVGNSCTYQHCLCEGVAGPPLISLAFSSCFGSGAAAHVSEPGGVAGENTGPISAVAMDSPGEGYAVLGRVSPAVDGIAGGSGHDAVIETTLEETKGHCDLPVWKVASITVKNGGSGYVNLETVTLSTSDGIVEKDGLGILHTKNLRPTTLAVSPTGQATVFAISIASNEDTPETWKITKVDASGDLGGWGDDATLRISLSNGDVAFRDADIHVRTIRSALEVSATVSGDSGGAGASLSVSLEKFADANGRDGWRVFSISIDNGGAGYATGDAVSFSVVDDPGFDQHVVFDAVATVGEIGESGEVLSIAVANAGEYWRDTGTIDSVEVRDGGAYGLAGVVDTITLAEPGKYYKEDRAAEPLIAEVTIEITQNYPSNGSGADLEAVVDRDVSSGSFGQITGVTVKHGGSGYLAYNTLTRNCITVSYPGPEQHLISLAITACHGSGASATVPETSGGAISSVNVISGGGGYAIPHRVAPTLDSMTAYYGDGAEFSASLSQADDKCGVPTWSASSVSVTKGGYGYKDNAHVTLKSTDHRDVCVAPAIGVLHTKRAAPTLTAQPAHGNTFSVSVSPLGESPENWKVSSVSFSGSGSEWKDGEAVSVLAGEHDQQNKAAVVRVRTGANSTSIDRIDIVDGGSYCLPGVIDSISIAQAGAYYREDPTGAAYVSDVSIEIKQKTPSAGEGGVLKATVDSSPGSSTFGQITSIEVENGGTKYLTPYQPQPSVSVSRDTCSYVMTAKDFVAKCDNFAFSAEHEYASHEADDDEDAEDGDCAPEGKADVSPGGTYNPGARNPHDPCCGCCSVALVCKTDPPLNADDCEAAGGTFSTNHHCDQRDCAGICCIDGVDNLDFVTKQSCESAGGIWKTGEGARQNDCSKCGCSNYCAFGWVPPECHPEEYAFHDGVVIRKNIVIDPDKFCAGRWFLYESVTACVVLVPVGGWEQVGADPNGPDWPKIAQLRWKYKWMWKYVYFDCDIGKPVIVNPDDFFVLHEDIQLWGDPYSHTVTSFSGTAPDDTAWLDPNYTCEPAEPQFGCDPDQTFALVCPP